MSDPPIPFKEIDEDHPKPERFHQQCIHCGRKQAPAETQASFASKYARERFDRFWEELDAAIEDLDEMFPGTPVREYMEHRCERLRRGVTLLRKGLDNELTLEEECELQNILNEVESDDA